MDRVELLTVDRVSWIPAQGKGFGILSVWPNFSVPEGWESRGWNERLEPVLIVRPDGQQIEATAHISVTHLHVIGEDVPMDLLWRISVWFMDRAEGDIPIGSRILVGPEIKDAIFS